MSEDGDVDVESAEDVPEIGGEATATTANASRIYVSPPPSWSVAMLMVFNHISCGPALKIHCTKLLRQRRRREREREAKY